ncbi:hypothetical protein [Roseibium aggregatum]|uniref:Uncharacterized protein n=1 Tax=Roseibium aggregatum TaxID=187304 RepID=A0A939J465_9HYPH|nr:hypothetical protein [Roseibium aggregatum]MBN9670379.1 hypothetical protein [Roseibium aggregatum]
MKVSAGSRNADVTAACWSGWAHALSQSSCPQGLEPGGIAGGASTFRVSKVNVAFSWVWKSVCDWMRTKTAGGFVLPEPGDFVMHVVGQTADETDIALCIGREGNRVLIRYQIWQEPGPWHESWVTIVGPSGGCGIWKTERLTLVGEALKAERKRLFPEIRENT